MAWIPSDQRLARHPKTIVAARLLGLSRPTLIGHLHLLWWWALDFAPGGCLDRYPVELVAEGAEWTGDPQRFVDALVAAGFLDQDAAGLRLHDWEDYVGRLNEQREAAAERKRRWRERARTQERDAWPPAPAPLAASPAAPAAAGAFGPRPVPLRSRATEENMTGHDLTGPDTTGPDRTGDDRTRPEATGPASSPPAAEPPAGAPSPRAGAAAPARAREPTRGKSRRGAGPASAPGAAGAPGDRGDQGAPGSPGDLRRTELFAALAAACGLDAARLTRSERGMVDAAARQLGAVGYGPGDVRTMAVNWATHFGECAMTPTGIAKHASRLLRAGGRSDGWDRGAPVGRSHGHGSPGGGPGDLETLLGRAPDVVDGRTRIWLPVGAEEDAPDPMPPSPLAGRG